MKINVFLLVIALFIGALVFYCFHILGQTFSLNLLGTGACTIALVAAMGIKLKAAPRETTMFKTSAIICFCLLLIINFLSVLFNAGLEVTIILNCVLVLSGILVLYFIYRTCYENNDV